MGGGFFGELKRRNVPRAAILYIGSVWALAQGIASLAPVVGAPEGVTRWFLAAAAIGSDTGGSCRIPAALCDIVGYKPTARTVPLDGALPLSFTLDSIGPLANSVDCCASLHEILSGTSLAGEGERSVRGLRIAVPQTIVFDGIEPYVAKTFETAIKRLADAGAVVTHQFQAQLASAAGRRGDPLLDDQT